MYLIVVQKHCILVKYISVIQIEYSAALPLKNDNLQQNVFRNNKILFKIVEQKHCV